VHAAGVTYAAQKEPAGQATGAPEEQSRPAAQGVQVAARMRLLVHVVMAKFPFAPTATPTGVAICALVPTPSAKAAAPEPASVETAPAGVMERTRLLR